MNLWLDTHWTMDSHRNHVRRYSWMTPRLDGRANGTISEGIASGWFKPDDLVMYLVMLIFRGTCS